MENYSSTFGAGGFQRGIRLRWAGCLVLAWLAGWGWLLLSARLFWGPNSYYNYGWTVPLLVGFLVFRKLRSARYRVADSLSQSKLLLFFTALGITLLLVTFFRLVLEVNPDWRIPLWAFALALLLQTLLAIWLLLGWKGLGYLFFPVCFVLVAIPWPYTLELEVIQSLTRWVTKLTATSVNLIGYPAVAMGNTIHVGDISVGVDEACSGIRSLQTLFMIGLFLGEFFSFTLLRRLLLVTGSVFVALGLNAIRTVSLTMVKITGTADQFNFWHDAMGNFQAVIGALLLFGLAELISRADEEKSPESETVLNIHSPPGRWTWGSVLLIAAGFLLTEGVVEAYYRYHEWQTKPLPDIAIEWPEDGSITEIPIGLPERTIKALRCDFSSKSEVRFANGMDAMVVFYGYTGEDLPASVAGYSHSPIHCIGGSGARLLEEKAPLEVGIEGIPWRVSHYVFAFDLPDGKKKLGQVFWMVWEPRQMGVSAEFLQTRKFWSTRWAAVLSGRRDFSRQILMMYVIGDYSDAFIRDQFTNLVNRIVILKYPSEDVQAAS